MRDRATERGEPELEKDTEDPERARMPCRARDLALRLHARNAPRSTSRPKRRFLHHGEIAHRLAQILPLISDVGKPRSLWVPCLTGFDSIEKTLNLPRAGSMSANENNRRAFA